MVTGIFGLPGSGKSTFLAMLAKKYQSRGYDVFINREFPIDGCYLYDWSDIGRYDISRALILIDEVSLYADNRDFKKFTAQLKEFFALHRHYKTDIIWCTQQYDGVDRKIRELTRELFYIRPTLFGMSYVVQLERVMYVPTRRDLSKNSSADISVKWVRPGLLRLLLSPVNRSMRICFRRRYYKYFDTFQAPKLPYKPFFRYWVKGGIDRTKPWRFELQKAIQAQERENSQDIPPSL